MEIVQINLIVADLARSRSFYEQLGLEFVSRSRTGEGPAEAWVADNGGVTLVLHSTAFAAWWDESAPRPTSGGPQVDFALDSAERLAAAVAAREDDGGQVIKPATAMPWGEMFAIVSDPDGYRVGLKAPNPTADSDAERR